MKTQRGELRNLFKYTAVTSLMYIHVSVLNQTSLTYAGLWKDKLCYAAIVKYTVGSFPHNISAST